MEFKEIKNKSLKELNELLAEKRGELRELKFKASENQLKKVNQIKRVKHNIARIQTAITVKTKQTDQKPQDDGNQIQDNNK